MYFHSASWVTPGLVTVPVPWTGTGNGAQWVTTVTSPVVTSLPHEPRRKRMKAKK